MVYNQAGNNKNKNFNLNTAAYLEVQPLKNLIYKGQLVTNNGQVHGVHIFPFTKLIIREIAVIKTKR